MHANDRLRISRRLRLDAITVHVWYNHCFELTFVQMTRPRWCSYIEWHRLQSFFRVFAAKREAPSKPFFDIEMVRTTPYTKLGLRICDLIGQERSQSNIQSSMLNSRIVTDSVQELTHSTIAFALDGSHACRIGGHNFEVCRSTWSGAIKAWHDVATMVLECMPSLCSVGGHIEDHWVNLGWQWEFDCGSDTSTLRYLHSSMYVACARDVCLTRQHASVVASQRMTNMQRSWDDKVLDVIGIWISPQVNSSVQ